MENSIKKYIDGLKKKRIKSGLDELDIKDKVRKKSYEKEIEEDYFYDRYLGKVLENCIDVPYLPMTESALELYGLLGIEVSYKQSFKIACDANHPLLVNLLEDLGLDESQISICIKRVKNFNLEKLDYYYLFEDELRSNDITIKSVVHKIDQLAQDCSQGTVISHSAKMTNPACKYPKIYVEKGYEADGFVKTGNSLVDFDMHINATKLKVFKFLSLKYEGKLLLSYVKEKNTRIFVELFDVSEEKSMEWCLSFQSCVIEQDYRTDRLIKQVYFPVSEQNYHLLSPLQPSGLVFSMKEKIDWINDRSPSAYEGKQCRKKEAYSNVLFSTLHNLTVTKHGGDHPKNISGLNNKFQSFYLLRSIPPTISKRNIRFPKHNFFKESLRYYECREQFHALHKILKTDYNNIKIREGRDYRLQEIIDNIIDRMWAVRSVSREQYLESSSQLKPHQKIWLSIDAEQEREDTDQWLDKLCKEISQWISQSYSKVMGKQAIKLGDNLRIKINEMVEQNKEALR